jgi:hypothetical protein
VFGRTPHLGRERLQDARSKAAAAQRDSPHGFVNLIYCNAGELLRGQKFILRCRTYFRRQYVERGSKAKNNLNNFKLAAL